MAKVMLEDWSLAMCVCSLPWAMAMAMGGTGYWVSLTFLRAYRREKVARRGRH